MWHQKCWHTPSQQTEKVFDLLTFLFRDVNICTLRLESRFKLTVDFYVPASSLYPPPVNATTIPTPPKQQQTNKETKLHWQESFEHSSRIRSDSRNPSRVKVKGNCHRAFIFLRVQVRQSNQVLTEVADRFRGRKKWRNVLFGPKVAQRDAELKKLIN